MKIRGLWGEARYGRERKGAYRVLVGKPEGRIPQRFTFRLQGIIKMGIPKK
jgi:hypothetical protein